MATKAQYQAAKATLAKIDGMLDESESINGTIQPETMVRLSHAGVIDSDPTLHTQTSYEAVCRAAGMEQDEDGTWFAAEE